MARRKIVFVIVEGPSDDEALGMMLEKTFDKNTVFVHITHGDITSMEGIHASNIINAIANMVKGYAKSNHLGYSRFLEIIHIIDMDGAFVPDDCIVYDAGAKKPVYSLMEIRTANRIGIQHRNEIKRQCINRLSNTSTVWSIPYQIYYMSCNLDHVLYDKQNSSDDEKEADALSFALRYRNDLDGFIRYMTESDFSVITNYLDSWKYIKGGVHSLERHSNLGICLQEAINI